MTKKRWGLDVPGAFVGGISRSEMTKVTFISEFLRNIEKYILNLFVLV